MTFQLEEARKAGYSDDEIQDFLSKQHPNFDVESAKKAGYSPDEIMQFLSSQKTPEPEGFLYQTTRALSQIPQGGLEATKAGLVASGLKHVARGEALAELDELEERLPELKKLFPQLEFPEKIDREKYLKAVESASKTVPDVQNIAAVIESKTGIPLAPKTSLDRAIRFMASLGQFKGGTASEKGMAALKGEAAKEVMEEVGIPEPAAEALALYYALHQKSPEIKVSQQQPVNPAEGAGGGTTPGAGASTGGTQPPPGPGGGIGPGTELPQTVSSYGLKQQALEALKASPEAAKPFGVNIPKIPKEGQPIRDAKLMDNSVEVNIPKIPKEGQPIRDAKLVDTPVGDVITKDPLRSEFKEGTESADTIKRLAKEEKIPVNKAYAKAKKVSGSHVDIYPNLAKQIEELVSDLEGVQLRNPGQESVYKQAKALEQLVGTSEGLLEVSAKQLIDQSDAIGALANYDMTYAGYKNVLKRLVKQTNEAVISSLKDAGLNYKAVEDADLKYSKWADKFLADEVSPFLTKKINNPEELFRRIVNDEGTYRAVKNAVGSNNNKLIDRLNKAIVESKLDKFYNNPETVGNKVYEKTMRDLRDLIGENDRLFTEKVDELDSFLKKRKVQAERQKGLGRRITEAEKGRIAKPSKTIEERRREKPSERQKSLERLITEAEKGRVAKASKTIEERRGEKPSFTKTSDLDKAFKSPDDIRQLHKELKKVGREDLFKKLAEDKIVEIYKKGKYGSKKLKGSDITDVIDQNHEVLTELQGEESLSEMYRVGKEHASEELILEFFKDVGKKLIKVGIGSSILKSIITDIPI